MSTNELRLRGDVQTCNLRPSAQNGDIDEKDEGSINSQSIVSQRITIAGGFLDVALFVADVEHLKFIFDTGRDDIEYYDLLLSLLFVSLILQILVGILIFIVGFGKNINQTKSEAKWTQILNYIIIGLVSLIALTNIFVTVFGDRGEAITQYRDRHHCSANARNYTQIDNNFKSLATN